WRKCSAWLFPPPASTRRRSGRAARAVGRPDTVEMGCLRRLLACGGGPSWVRYSFSSAAYQWRTALVFSIPTSLCSGYEPVDTARVNPLTALLAGGVAPSEAAWV